MCFPRPHPAQRCRYAWSWAERNNIPEENQQEAHTAFADDRRNLRIETASGLRFFISFYLNYDWIEGGGTMSYFKIDNQMHGWIERNLNR